MSLRRSLLPGLLASTVFTPVWAQEGARPAPAPVTAPARTPEPAEAAATEAADDEFAVEEVLVTGQRGRGAALGDIPPEFELNAEEIRALGAGTLSELLQVLEPQIRSGRGRGGEGPVFLLNGRRISGFSEIRGVPPEAIERFEVLPEEVGLRYGFRPDQRVVNIVLRERFRAAAAELEAGAPTAGGRVDSEADLSLLRIDRQGRSNLDIEYRRSTALLESERDLVQADRGAPFDIFGNIGGVSPGAEIDPALSALAGRRVTVAGVPASGGLGAPGLADFAPEANIADLGAYRTLLPETDRFSVNGTVNRTILGDVSATVNARYDTNASRSLFGLSSAAFLLPPDNPFSPFERDVLLYRYLDVARPLSRETEGDTAHLGLTLDSYAGGWRWSLTANYDRSASLTRTDGGFDPGAAQARLDAGDAAFNPFAPLPHELIVRRPRDEGRSVTRTANTELVVNGALRELAAGPLSTTFKGALETRGFESETLRAGARGGAELSRDRGAVQVSFDLPIASRRREVRTWLGNLSANGNLAVDQLSDFGTLTKLGYGLNWSPHEKLTLLASFTDDDGSPSVQQLGNPVLVSPNVPVFDFTRGQTVEVTRIEGGNAALLADNRRVLNLNATLRPYQERDLSLTMSYTATSTRDPITGFPGVTAEIEAAFPERFERDQNGRLVSVDVRPINFASSDRREARWGLNWSKPLRRSGETGAAGAGGRRPAAGGPPGSARAPGERPAGAQAQTVSPQSPPAPADGAGQPGGGPRRRGQGAAAGSDRAGPDIVFRPGGGPGGGPGPGGFAPGGGGRGGGGFRGGRPGEGRLQFSLYHTLRLEDSILIREGGPELDLLEGATLGGGGRPRHEIDVQTGLFRSGFGAFLNARWQSGTTVLGRATGAEEAASDLFFSDLATVNLRVFANLGQQRSLVQRHPWLRGSRVSLAVSNLFDARQEVRDEAGATPLSYQPAFQDPLGRSVRVSFRKLFSRPPPGAVQRRRAAGSQ